MLHENSMLSWQGGCHTRMQDKTFNGIIGGFVKREDRRYLKSQQKIENCQMVWIECRKWKNGMRTKLQKLLNNGQIHRFRGYRKVWILFCGSYSILYDSCNIYQSQWTVCKNY